MSHPAGFSVLSFTLLALFSFLSASRAKLAVPPTRADAGSEVSSDEHASPALFAWADFDGDGRLDLAAVGAGGTLQLLASAGEDRFEDVTEQVGLAGISNAALASWADYDGDLRLDLFVGAREGQSRLFHNEGGSFVDMSAGSGLVVEGAVQSAHWLDHDGDGRLDLHVVTAEKNVLFHGLEGGLFEATGLPLVGTPTLVPMGESLAPAATVATPHPCGATDAESERLGITPESTRRDRPPGSGVTSNRRTPGGSGTSAAMPSPACVPSLEDRANPGSCLLASTTPMLGRLFPISSNLFVAVGGNVGIGTTSPAAKLDVAGTARISDTLTLDPPGDQALNVSTGSIYKSGALFIHTKGSFNTALGREALSSVTTGFADTAIGDRALFSNTTGFFNTACGYRALYSNTTGYHNTADGARALHNNTTGSFNTACGMNAMVYNTTGYYNTAIGTGALAANSAGTRNTAVGYQALVSNTTGDRNTAVGFQALKNNTTGSSNIAIGEGAGSILTTGSRNIDIGHPGFAGESNTIRIGSLQTRTFIAGVRSVGIANSIPVLIDSNGQLGTVSSSRRFKEEIRDMGALTERLLQLRPVVFRYKAEVQPGERPLEYGLIAEEVAEVFPELVVHDDDGKPFTVKYHLLSSMLLNEFERLHGTIETRKALHARELNALRERLALQTAEMDDLRSGLARLKDFGPQVESFGQEDHAAGDGLSE